MQNTKTVHGPHQCSPRVRLPAGQSLQNWMILAHMVMNDTGKCKKGSRHGVMAEAGKQGMARQAHAEQAAGAQQAGR